MSSSANTDLTVNNDGSQDTPQKSQTPHNNNAANNKKSSSGSQKEVKNTDANNQPKKSRTDSATEMSSFVRPSSSSSGPAGGGSTVINRNSNLSSTGSMSNRGSSAPYAATADSTPANYAGVADNTTTTTTSSKKAGTATATKVDSSSTHLLAGPAGSPLVGGESSVLFEETFTKRTQRGALGRFLLHMFGVKAVDVQWRTVELNINNTRVDMTSKTLKASTHGGHSTTSAPHLAAAPAAPAREQPESANLYSDLDKGAADHHHHRGDDDAAPSVSSEKIRLLGADAASATYYSSKPPAESTFNPEEFTDNAINNRRYNVLTFLPMALFHQFKLFFNIFFLMVALSQFVPALRVGPLFIYFAPLAFVVALSLLKDGWDDFNRFRRDLAANNEKYEVLGPNGVVYYERAQNIRVGDIIILHQKSRIPADCVLLHTTEATGASFIRTDQLDGETDWKLRFPIKHTHHMKTHEEIAAARLRLICEPPHRDIYAFSGAAELDGAPNEGISLENTLWANCVVASGTVTCAVVYTGKDTRSALNANRPTSKSGLFDAEVNRISTVCFAILALLALLLVVEQRFRGRWYIMFFRFVILFSSIIPISMRVNIDVARLWYSFVIYRDPKIPGTLVRNTNIPEELGRIQFLFSDKTGTLTKNIMEFRSLQLGPQFCLQHDNEDDFNQALDVFFAEYAAPPPSASSGPSAHHEKPHKKQQHKIIGFSQQQIREIGNAVLGLALCHNVTPVFPDEDEEENVVAANATTRGGDVASSTNGRELSPRRDEHGEDLASHEAPATPAVEYQASSPDEVAMVKFAASVRVVLHERTLKKIVLRIPSSASDGSNSSTSAASSPTGNKKDRAPYSPTSSSNGGAAADDDDGRLLTYTIVKMFPFSSERKSMSIIIKEEHSGAFFFYMKGADVRMRQVVRRCDWLDESCQEMAEKGLRTLVFARKPMSADDVDAFMTRLQQANAVLGDGRARAVEDVMCQIEQGLELIGITGVEDQLQDDVTSCLETLGMCGVKVWMLTGDKVETATCIGRSTLLVPRHGEIVEFLARTSEDAERMIEEMASRFDHRHAAGGLFGAHKWALVLDGTCLSLCLTPELEERFANVARLAHSVIVARCSPTQKAAVVQCIRKYSPSTLRTAAIGDGGNDVSMILASNCGIGVEGLEGKQASMAADFSITKFSHCLRLIMWHGRNSYIRSCNLSQFIIHRGIVYAVVQAVFSLLFMGSTMSVFNGYLLMGYATIFTMAPAFALVLDEDHFESDISEFPQLYKSLLKGRKMNIRSFLQWVWISFLQGGIMMYLSVDLFTDEMFQIVSIAYTALLLTELVIVAAGVHFRVLWRQRRLHFSLFIAAEAFSICAFFFAVMVLPDTIDRTFFYSVPFWSKTMIITAASVGPIFVLWMVLKYIVFRKSAQAY